MILITGIDTPYGLAVARRIHEDGHCVVGADVGDFPLRSGGGMSKMLDAYYRIPTSQYASRLLDIINREKVDVWIPCAGNSSPSDDAVAKQVIESRTRCKCIQFDSELTACFDNRESFLQYLVGKGLPVAENYQVRSRDSVHKILHRSPRKTYHMRRLSSDKEINPGIVLPKRTPSLTYSEISALQISKDNPWVLQEYGRLGEFLVDLLLVRGNIQAMKVRPANNQVNLGHCHLDQAIFTAIHRLVESFAAKGGSRLTGHLSIQVMVDEEFGPDHSVRHSMHIAGCTQGATAVNGLLIERGPSLTGAYISILSSQTSGSPSGLMDVNQAPISTIMASSSDRQIDLLELIRAFVTAALGKYSLPRVPSINQVSKYIQESSHEWLFWNDPAFSTTDPLPWWWNSHVFRPAKQLSQTLGAAMGSN